MIGVACLESMSNSPIPSHVDEALRWLVHDYIDDAILGVTFEVHRALKTGLLEAELGDRTDENQYLQVNVEGLDVFGQAPVKKSHECVCPNCSRSLAASRFAPHLEKCMGMGRNSSRIASRRIQNTSREGGQGASAIGGVGGPASDDDADDDWILDRKKRKRDKSSPRRSRKFTAKTAAEGVSWSIISSSTDSEKRAVLSSICGVVSEHTRKMCTRSMKCPQHTNFQRRAVREQLLGTTDASAAAEEDAVTSTSASVQEDVQAEGESLEEEGRGTASTASSSAAQSSSGAGGSGGSSWDQDLHHSSTTSPADSTSTVLSSHSTNSSNRSSSLPPNGDSNCSVITSSLGGDSAPDGGHALASGSGNKSNSSNNNSSSSSRNSNSRSAHGKKKSSKSSSHSRAHDK